MHSKQQSELEKALAECQRLRQENIELRRLLAEQRVDRPATLVPVLPTPEQTLIEPAQVSSSRAEERIRLFRSLFRGREDIYAVRWETPDGRHGYSPRSDRDWKAYYASSALDRKKVDRKTRKYHPLTDEVVRAHLMGEQTIGVYPLLTDGTCWFLAADFDKAAWAEDASAFLKTCGDMGVSAALERSRSGKGGHVWIFFDRTLPAIIARKLGSTILTRTMEHRHQVGLDSYNRFFPNQDTMPKGGFGNLIALPLQRGPRAHGNSAFVDGAVKPTPISGLFWPPLKGFQGMMWKPLSRTLKGRGT